MATAKLPRIGYVPYAANLAAPGDRRRFAHYARARGLSFELASPDKDYDLVVLSERADITVWPHYRKGVLIYDLIDSYLDETPLNLRRLLRGAFKYAKGEHRWLKLGYRNCVTAMCRRADAVICSTAEQKTRISPYNANVHAILDIHSSETRSHKTDYRADRPFKIVWEGLTSNLKQLATIRHVLANLTQTHDMELHILTDPQMPRYFHHFGTISTKEYCNGLFHRPVVHPWEEKTFASIVAGCDLAVIPINMADSFAVGKPENKLVLLWKAGIPVLTSPTPAYTRTMTSAGVPGLAHSPEEWTAAIHSMMGSEDRRRDNARRGQRFAMENYSEATILDRWDTAMLSCGFDFTADQA